jgi:hypothetical protein
MNGGELASTHRPERWQAANEHSQAQRRTHCLPQACPAIRGNIDRQQHKQTMMVLSCRWSLPLQLASCSLAGKGAALMMRHSLRLPPNVLQCCQCPHILKGLWASGLSCVGSSLPFLPFGLSLPQAAAMRLWEVPCFTGCSQFCSLTQILILHDRRCWYTHGGHVPSLDCAAGLPPAALMVDVPNQIVFPLLNSW